MGTISSGIGLISGMDIQDIVSQLIGIESRPRELMETRVEGLTEQQTALMKIQALVMSAQIAAAGFNKDFVFQQKAVTSSNEEIITATADKFATEGTYRFTVKNLANNHHFVSRPYTSLDSNLGSGTISFEIGQGQLSRPTELNFINGQSGFQRGKVRVTDCAGNTADIDLTATLTVQDILDQFNSNTTVNVTASVSGDQIVIADNNVDADDFRQWRDGVETGRLIIADIGTGHTAADLGILGTADYDPAGVTRITGSDILRITADTLLGDLNDGNGIRGLDSPLEDIRFNLADSTVLDVDLKNVLHETIGDDTKSTTLKSLNGGGGVRMGTFRITDQNGRFVDIDLNDFSDNYGPNATLAQLKNSIEEATTANNMDITVSFGGMDHFKITDNSDPIFAGDEDSNDYESTSGQRKSNFIIEDLDGGSAAADLGIADDVSGDNIHGQQIWFMETLGDITNAVNNHWNNWDSETATTKLTLAVDAAGDGLKAEDHTAGAGTLTIENINTSTAADDLGLITPLGYTGTEYTGRRLIAGLNTVMLRSLNGGTGGDPDDSAYGSNRITEGGAITITDRAGNSVVLDGVEIANAFTVQDVLDVINNPENNINISASVNATGNGIVLTDTTNAEDVIGNLRVADLAGSTLAQKLNIAVDDAVGTVQSGNLQLQYINESIKLNDLRQGQGVRRGEFTVTDGLGDSATIDLASDDIDNLGDVIERFKLSGTGIRARINDQGDGLILYDVSQGDNLKAFTVAEKGSFTAHDLGILGTAEAADDGEYYIDGSYEFELELGGSDSIEDIVGKINTAQIGLSASIINDGSGYRISFNSQISGRAGNVYLDAGTTQLTAETLSLGRDAIVFLGDGSDEHPLLISSSNNTIEDAIKGTTLDLVSAGEEAVEINIKQDLDSITSQIGNFVEAYNVLMEELASVSSFNPDTYERGILFADHTVSTIRSTMETMVHKVVAGLGSNLNRLSQIGLGFAPFTTETVTGADGKTSNIAVARTLKLDFDEDKFRSVFAEDPEGVAELFTKADVGIGDYIAEKLERLAGSHESTIKNRLDSMQSSQKLYQQRIEHLNELLQSKEDRLYKEFYAMEQALATMQSQQSALSSLSSMATSSTSSS